MLFRPLCYNRIMDAVCMVGTQDFTFHLSSLVAVLTVSPLLGEYLTLTTLWRSIWVWPETRPQQEFFCILGLCFCYKSALFIQPLEAPWKSVLICLCIVTLFPFSFAFRLQCLSKFWDFKENTVYELLDWESWHLFLVSKVEHLVVAGHPYSSFREGQGPPKGNSIQPKMDA